MTMYAQQSSEPQGGFPPVIHHFTDAVGEEFRANTDSDTYKKLVIVAGQTAFHERVMNMIERGQPVDALKQLSKALDKIKPENFHRTMTTAVQALRMLERSGDQTVASVLKLIMPPYKVDHENRYVPDNKNTIKPPAPALTRQ